MYLKFFSGILAFFSMAALERMILRVDGLPILSNSIFSIFIFAAVWKFFISVFKIINKRLLFLSLILGGIFSTFMVFGTNIFSNEETGITHAKTWFNIFGGTPFFAAIIIWLFNKFENFNVNSNSNKSVSTKKYFLISWTLIFFAWIPPLFAQFPGIYAYDSISYVCFYIEDIVHMMVTPVYTAVLGFFTVTIGNLLGSYERGLLIYTMFQMLSLSAVFALSLTYMHKKNLPSAFKIAWLLFFMFFPINPIMAMSATKDTLFSVFFAAMIFIFFISMEKDVKYFYPLAITFCFLTMLFRSQGIYVVALGIIFGLLIMKDFRIKLLKILTASLILFFAHVNILVNFFNGIQDPVFEKREMLGVPVIQIARVAVFRKNELSKDEIKQIKKYIPTVDTYKNFIARGSTDPFRGFRADLFHEDPHEFFDMYKKYALKYPLDYFEAFCRLTVGHWYPDLSFRKYYDRQPYFQYESFKKDSENHLLVERGKNRYNKLSVMKDPNLILIKNETFSGFHFLHDFYYKLAYDYSYERIPVISMLFSTGFTFWLILIFVFYCLYKKNYRALFPASFLILLWLTMLLGPLSLWRYTFPLLINIPFLFAYILGNKLNEGE